MRGSLAAPPGVLRFASMISAPTLNATTSAPRANLVRAASVMAMWGVAMLPPILGIARCPSAQLFHRACPGCGMTRAVHCLAHGDLAGSLAMHPLAIPTVLSLAFLALVTVWMTYARGTPTPLLETRIGRVAVAIVLVVHLALVPLWIARALGAFGGLPPV